LNKRESNQEKKERETKRLMLIEKNRMKNDETRSEAVRDFFVEFYSFLESAANAGKHAKHQTKK